ncbi:MAG: GTP-binding protein [Gammaproteobacteria bacterium]|nr:GTP-binding protein [Gammaproteobacteria bacterium]
MIGRLIPTNVITGFLGTGKTTAILHLLHHVKPANERWAILVNEFGEIGIDGALLSNQGAAIKEITGGCICCVAGLPMQVGLNQLLAQEKWDRLIIELTGLGHPAQVLRTLRNAPYSQHLEVRATLTLVDPRKLQDSRYTSRDEFKEQIACADIIVANKTDVCSHSDQQAFEHFIATQAPADIQTAWLQQGEIAARYLDIAASPRHSIRQSKNILEDDLEILPLKLDEGQKFLRREHRDHEYVSCGWLFSSNIIFSFEAIFTVLNNVQCDRLKATINTNRGMYAFNAAYSILHVTEIPYVGDSRLELINSYKLDWQTLENQILLCSTLRSPHD